MGKLLFSPDGRISSSEFMKGAVILLALNFFLWLSWFAGMGFGFFAAIVAIFTIYCWACLFIKRFHDAGKSGWLFIPVLAVFLVLVLFVLPLVTFPIFPVSEEALQAMQVIEDFQQANSQPTTIEEISPMLEAADTMMKARAIPSSIIYFLGGLITAFGTNKLLKSDPEANRWG